MDERQEQAADLAALIVSLARRIADLPFTDPEIVSLSPLEVLVLRHIDQRDAISPSELGRQLGLKSSNTSAALRALTELGLVRRTRSEQDRRVIEVSLTDRARDTIERVRAERSALLLSLIADDAELSTTVALLGRIEEKLWERD
ncbi:MarR family winged helix-turn-helix transcriptional regulator [Naumannella halotolerans]|uniref:DNA-binding MarR family transcriptional regulator n=1 Tax=Naumannella halotolerans TaxID=993414 RepID=A0A4R7J7U6_9ACTN|nr:MarR family transcriptional regulator [Naumannella halotolerans]TDT32533.1 DNA-binding MarR family transcriptional regulator [Naumannella halotolerans]